MSSYNDYRLSSDTSRRAEELIFQLLGQKSPAERLQMVSKSNALMRTLSITGLRERHPQATDDQLKVLLAELLYGKNIASKVADRLTSTQDRE